MNCEEAERLRDRIAELEIERDHWRREFKLLNAVDPCSAEVRAAKETRALLERATAELAAWRLAFPGYSDDPSLLEEAARHLADGGNRQTESSDAPAQAGRDQRPSSGNGRFPTA